ncbi:histidine phosphatase superfamily [Neohortaea acidophila]|uniref:Histidine phosphatase superfamily n=1 Tax=Neohortaea acidophila TaxID=245834 RepID=A0A6A6Q0Y0_9PEZI|nr:histidine phosphatase superfamily [Neohortaea acidophila]KAF2485343.1 histidine phosphatase superfamily [Neohortaea acidophila]
MGSIPARKYSFESVKGFFLQDDPATNQTDFHYEAVNFGLIDRAYDTDTPGDADLTQWQRFAAYVRHLIETSPADTTYKLIYNGRHGEGYHNVGEAKYGTQAWNDYWSKLDGDGELYWFDAHLTAKGTQQALHNHAFLKRQFAQEKMPAPQKYYSSPLYRCLQTANLTYLHLDVPVDAPFTPTIKEMMREVMGEHTCDKRSSKAVIHKAVPSWNIETGFTEEDELWRPDHRETFAEHDARTHALLEDIFEHDSHAVLSFTSHSGAIASLLRVMGHREFGLPTGALIPLLVRATRTQ